MVIDDDATITRPVNARNRLTPIKARSYGDASRLRPGVISSGTACDLAMATILPDQLVHTILENITPLLVILKHIKTGASG